MALASSPEAPLPLRTVVQAVAQWVNRLGAVWVEGQVAQLSDRPGTATVFLTLRDPAVDVSMTVTCAGRTLRACVPGLAPGARVVVHARPSVFVSRGQLQLTATEIRQVGVGELLAQVERRKQMLQAEGLFDPRRKRPLPLLPQRVGLITGRASAAERDVVSTAQRRWPAVTFTVRPVAVQGPTAAAAVVQALQDLDRDPTVDVIIIARGGGSVEDLLPFSEEPLLRAVALATTPVISAIGHEPDAPLLDFVADVRAATPTDAGKRVVPDIADELAHLRRHRAALQRAVRARVAAERAGLAALRSRPALRDPAAGLAARREDVHALRARGRHSARTRLQRAAADLAHTAARLRGLSPQATLDRGYAVLTDTAGRVQRDAGQLPPGSDVTARLAVGRLRLRTVAPDAA